VCLSTCQRPVNDAAAQAFDLLYLNGESLLQKSFEDRRAALKSAFKETEGRFAFAVHLDYQEVSGHVHLWNGAFSTRW
jgi:ATP-dependent DNA ligase